MSSSNRTYNSIDRASNNNITGNINTLSIAPEVDSVPSPIIEDNASNHNQSINSSESKEQHDIRLVDIAVRNDDVNGVEQFLNQHPQKPYKLGSKPLISQLKLYSLATEAAEHGSLNVIKLLLEKNRQASHYAILFSRRIESLMTAIQSKSQLKLNLAEIARLITDNFTIWLDESEEEIILNIAADLSASNNSEELINVIERIVAESKENNSSSLEIPQNRNFLHRDFIFKNYPLAKEWLINPKGIILILDEITKASAHAKTIYALDIDEMFIAYLWFKENSNLPFANIFYKDSGIDVSGHQALYRLERIGHEIKFISLDSAPKESKKVMEEFHKRINPNALLNVEFIVPSEDYVQQTDTINCGTFALENLKRLTADQSFYQELAQKKLLITSDTLIKQYHLPARFVPLMTSWKQLKAFECTVPQEAKEFLKFDSEGKGLTARDCFLEKRKGVIKNPVAIKNRNKKEGEEKTVYKNTYISYCAYQYITQTIPNYLSAYENRKDELAAMIQSYTVNSLSVSAESLSLIKEDSDLDNADSGSSASNNLSPDEAIAPENCGDSFLNDDASFSRAANETSGNTMSDKPNSSNTQFFQPESTIRPMFFSNKRTTTENNTHSPLTENHTLNQMNMFAEASRKKQKLVSTTNNVQGVTRDKNLN